MNKLQKDSIDRMTREVESLTEYHVVCNVGAKSNVFSTSKVEWAMDYVNEMSVFASNVVVTKSMGTKSMALMVASNIP